MSFFKRNKTFKNEKKLQEFLVYTSLLLAGPKAQPTSVRQQIRILDIIATFDALFENDK